MACRKRQSDGPVITATCDIVTPTFIWPERSRAQLSSQTLNTIRSESRASDLECAFRAFSITLPFQKGSAILAEDAGIIPDAELQDAPARRITDRANVKTCYGFAHAQVCCLVPPIGEKAAFILRKSKPHVHHQENYARR